MTTTQIAATSPILALLVYYALKEGYSLLHRWYTNRRRLKQLRG